MAVDRFTVMAAMAAMSGPVLFARGFRNFRKRQLIANTPTAKVRSMAMGLVELNGTVEPRSLVTAPFSGRACVYWQIEVALRGKYNSWTTVHRNASGSPFFLRDETGLALVYPRGAECRLNFGVEEVCHGLAMPELYSSYLSEANVKSRHLWRLGTLRFRERTLEEGTRVYVLGTATPKPMVHTISDGEEMAATGTDDMDPWAARVRQRSAEATAIVRQGENETVFIISQSHEGELTTMLGIETWAQIIGGPLLAIGGLAYLLSAFR